MAMDAVSQERLRAFLLSTLANQGDVFTAGAGPENAGLALAAFREQRDEQTVLNVAVALDVSPMFGMLAASFDLEMARLGIVLPADSSADAWFAIRLFAARAFLAGGEVMKAVAA